MPAKATKRKQSKNPVGAAARRVLKLQKATQTADDQFQAALVKQYGKRAGDMRYRSQEHAPQIRTLAARFQKLNEELSKATAEMRKRGETVHDNPSTLPFKSREAAEKTAQHKRDKGLEAEVVEDTQYRVKWSRKADKTRNAKRKNAPKGATKGHRAVSKFFGVSNIDIIFNREPAQAMRSLSQQTGIGHGVEHIDAKEFSRKAGMASIRGIDYVNMGDPYTKTLIHDGKDFFIGAWGDLVEKYGTSKNPPGGRMKGGTFVAHGGRPMDQKKKAAKEIAQLVKAKKTWDGKPLDAAGRDRNLEQARELAKKHGLPMPAKNGLKAVAKKAVKAVKKAAKKAVVSLKQLRKNPPVMSVAHGTFRADVYPSGDKFMVAVPGEAPSGGFDTLKAASTYAKSRLARLKEKKNQAALLGVAGLEQVLSGRDSVTGKLLAKLGRRNPTKSNPKDAAEKMYEVFHGLPSTQVLQYRTKEHVHEWLSALGTLTSIEVVNAAGQKAKLKAPDPAEAEFEDVVMVCVTEDGKQIFFVGGDQSIPLDELAPKFGITEDDVRDHMLMGEVRRLIYRTQKIFENKGETTIDFFHDLGEEHAEGVLPVLEYKPLNPSMELVGGRYKIAPLQKSLGASPGVVG